MDSLPRGLDSLLCAVVVAGGSRSSGEQASGGDAAAPGPNAGSAYVVRRAFLGFYFLHEIFKLFAGIGCINQTVVSQRHRLCLLEPKGSVGIISTC